MISNLKKDESIKNALQKLSAVYGEENLELADYWDADLFAIGIENRTDKKHLIYISTFNLSADLYFVEVEKANSETDLMKYEVVECFKSINFEGLFEVTSKYLNLQRIYEQ
ncbi:MAG: hypothetical protein LUM44_14675 [Pyrinomonadaceae bacterium]|nr:hypothetical protein [Pyrinomonadaceae bacterium]